MNIVMIILYFVMCVLLWLLADWYKEEASRERSEKNQLQNRNNTAATILSTMLVDVVRTDGSFIDKDVIFGRLQDALIGLGYVFKRYTEAAADPPDTQEGG